MSEGKTATNDREVFITGRVGRSQFLKRQTIAQSRIASNAKMKRLLLLVHPVRAKVARAKLRQTARNAATVLKLAMKRETATPKGEVKKDNGRSIGNRPNLTAKPRRREARM